MSNQYAQELEFALYMASQAGKVILSYFQKPIQVESKSDNTPVTLADRQAEELIRTLIAQHTPSYGIIGEEFGQQVGNENRQWVIDPIDGTKAFIHGVPLFGTLIALLENGKPVVGVIALPALGHQLSASLGGGAKIDGVACKVSSCAQVDKALLLDGSISTMERLGYAEPWSQLRHKAGLHRGWGDCYGHFLVATGQAEAMVDPVVEIWDVAPMAIILPEAGGRFTSLQGNDSVTERTGISSNGLIHEEILATFAPYIKAL